MHVVDGKNVGKRLLKVDEVHMLLSALQRRILPMTFISLRIF